MTPLSVLLRCGSVSFIVSFSYVQRRPACTSQHPQPRSRTLPTFAGLGATDLESALGRWQRIGVSPGSRGALLCPAM